MVKIHDLIFGTNTKPLKKMKLKYLVRLEIFGMKTEIHSLTL